MVHMGTTVTFSDTGHPHRLACIQGASIRSSKAMADQEHARGGALSVRVLIANERPEIRKILRDFVERNSHWKICAEVADGGDAVSKAYQLTPELIILDLAMPVLNGIEAAREILKFHPGARLLLCASHVTPEERRLARQAGIKAIIAQSRVGRIPHALQSLFRDNSLLADLAALDPSSNARESQSSPDPHDPMTLRSAVVSRKIFLCEAVTDGASPMRKGLILDPEPLSCVRCDKRYNLHYSSLFRPQMVHLSRMLAAEVLEGEHPSHSARVNIEVTPSNAVN